MYRKPLFAVFLAASASLAVLAQPERTAWDVLKQGPTDKNPETRRQAVTAAGSIGANVADAVKLVEEGLKDMDPLVRQTAAGELGEMKSTGSIPVLKAALGDSSAEVAFAAAKALWEMSDPSGRDLIEDVLTGQQKASEGVVSGAVQDAKRKMHEPKTLALMGLKEASGVLLGPFNFGVIAAEQAFKDGSAGARALSATMLARQCDAQSLRLLERACTDDKSWAVKATVAKALGQCGNPEAVPTLERYLSDSHAAVRFMAAAAIIKLELKAGEKQARSAASTPGLGF
jgi:HEAT repeat protein